MIGRDEIIQLICRISHAEAARQVAEGQVLEEHQKARARWGDRATIFYTEEGLVWIPDFYELRCVGVTKNGARCRNYVFDQGQVWRWDGPFALLDDDWLGRLLTQTCRTHDDGRASSYLTPEYLLLSLDDL